MESINSYTVALYKIVESYLSNTEQKNVILEPLSCVLKLSLLFYKPLGTKISITKNSIVYNDPNVYQGLLRSYSGDSRDDLHNLCYPLMISLNWFPKKDDKYAFFYEQCIQGLSYLKSNYDRNSLTNHTLSHYIELITNDDIKDESVLTASPLMSSLKDFWKPEEIEILYSLFQYAVNKDDEEKEFYLNMIENIISFKEKKLNDYIQSVSTKY